MNKNPKRENLKPFKKGESGNPNGRPKKLPEIDKILADVLGDETDGRSKAAEIVKVLVSKALKGDLRAAEILLDRAYGKAKQAIDLDAKGSLPVPIIQVLNITEE